MDSSTAAPHGTPDRIQYAGFGKRLRAFAFDYLAILAYVAVLLGLGLGTRTVVGPLEDLSPIFTKAAVLDAMAFLVLILPVMLYFTLQEGSPRQATWGKGKAGIRVVDANGDTLTRRRAFVRSFVKFLPWQVAHTSVFHVEGLPFAPNEPSPLVMAGFMLVYLLVGIYAAFALVAKDHRTPYDWAAGSYVIVEEPSRSPRG